MVLAEIYHTCSHAPVAHAAAASLGRDFYRHVQEEAHKRGVPTGTFVANSVRNFQANAAAHEKWALQKAVVGSDMPVLRGLEMIVSQELNRD
jgi:hypothetical protein